MKRIRIIAILSALVTALAVYLYLGSLKKPEEIRRLPVVVAAKEIQQGMVISENMVEIRMLPEEAVLHDAFSSKNAVVGSISGVGVKPGEQMLASKVFNAGETKSGLSYALEMGQRAFTIPVDAVSGVAGFIQPKDRVDVLLIIGVADKAPVEQGVPSATTYSEILLQYVLVLATGQVMKPAGSEAEPVLVDTVTLSVTPEQALRLNMATSEGRIRLVLRSPQDTEMTSVPGIVVADLVEGKTPAPAAVPTPAPTPDPTLSPENQDDHDE